MDLGSCGECKAPVPDPASDDFVGWSKCPGGAWDCPRCMAIDRAIKLLERLTKYLDGRRLSNDGLVIQHDAISLHDALTVGR